MKLFQNETFLLLLFDLYSAFLLLSFEDFGFMPLYKSISRYGPVRGVHKRQFRYIFKYLRYCLPEYFDARDHWPQCADSIAQISTQRECGSCWALSVANTISDRICIASKSKIKTRISPLDLMECIDKFSYNLADYKRRKSLCDVGDPYVAWKYFKYQGLVSERCKPYYEEAYQHDQPLVCSMKCNETTFPAPYHRDLHYGKDYRLLPTDEREIQWEILLHGPVVAVFDTYPSILDYTGFGIYSAGDREVQYGTHAVKLIGWGEERGMRFWIGLNTWGPNWGRNGAFRFARGDNECGIEDYVTAGIPEIVNNNKIK